MKNKNGFTLVELLAVIVLLGVIMLIAVPNVMSILDKNKKDIYISDATRMATLVEYKIREDTTIALPDNNEILVLPLYTFNNGDISQDPDGREYSIDDSYVAIMKVDGFDEYWVNLVGIAENGNRGVQLTKVDNLKDANRFDYVIQDMEIPRSNSAIATIMCGSASCKSVRTYSN